MFPRHLRIAIAGCALLLLAAAPAAQGEVRSATVIDPADATPTISGVPNNPDIRSVSVSYDTAGTLSISVSFYNAVNALDMSQNFAFFSQFTVGTAPNTPYLPCSSAQPGDISGQHHVFANSTTFFDRATVGGFDGYLNFTRITSADQHSITITGSSPAIANRDYRCMTYALMSRQISTVSNPYSNYDSGCDCWYVNQLLDNVSNADAQSAAVVWFDGFGPAAPVINKVHSRMQFYPLGGCGRIDTALWQLTPDRVGGRLRKYTGRMVFELTRGAFHRETRLRVINGSDPAWRHLRPGAYRMRASYNGDAYRYASNVVKRSVRVSKC